MQRNDILDNFEFDDYPEFGNETGEVVAKFYSPMEAEVAAARLRAEGIPCFVANSTSQSILPHLQLLVRLHVHPADAERARFILAEAAIDTTDSDMASKADNRVLIGMSVLIGVLLAILLVRAMWGRL